ncbi:MAG: hydrolase Nlp/P60 [Maricaulis sp.]|jgi:cell wall-associated NlpC family hydrolase|nr:hydrolase Nlp/P60 [Maricaulis sp.]HAQ33822.1 hydrolase Nlp/P60 [Alphaproteobacteria bacterium]
MTDRRTTPARADLAASFLEGQVKADRFVDPVDKQIARSAIWLRAKPSDDAPVDTQLLFGEVFAVLEEKDGWAWGFARNDGYVGYVRSEALSDEVLLATHRVSALRTYVFPEPDLKCEPSQLISLNARVSAGRRDGRYVEVIGTGWVPDAHITPINASEPDFVAVAERFLGTPYLWGGKTSLGLDCSALVQLALEAAGIPAPRDTDLQEVELGGRWRHLEFDMPKRRGDLVFWKGHVGIMLDGELLLHANAHHMATAMEPVTEAIERIEASAGPVTSLFRRAR